MFNRPFVNAVTREAFMLCLLNWAQDGDAASMAHEWLEMGSGNPNSAAELLEKDLKREVSEYYNAETDDSMADYLRRIGLRRVCWRQVADRLLELAPARAPATAQDAEEG